MALYGVCVLIFAGVVFVASHVLALLTPLVLAIAAALLLAALFEPLVHRLSRARVPRWLAALVSVLGGLVLVAGTLVLVGIAAADEASELADSAAAGIAEIERWLVDGLGLSEGQIGRLQTQLTERLQGSGSAGLQGAAGRRSPVTCAASR